MLIKKNTNKQGERKMYMHENVKVAFEQVTKMLKEKKTCKNGKVFFSLKDSKKYPLLSRWSLVLIILTSVIFFTLLPITKIYLLKLLYT